MSLLATVGVKATLISSEEMDEESVYTIVKTLFKNLDRLKRTHPSFASLTPAGMHTGGLAALRTGAPSITIARKGGSSNNAHRRAKM